jgi:hypothetical protein
VCLIVAVSGNTANAQSTAPTFNRDVAPILYQNCVTCHRPGEIAPMSLLSYKDARPWARSIKNKVLAGEMPPWGADPRYSVFRNAPKMTSAHVATLVAWVDAGAPEGTGTPPPAPTFPEGWNASMGRPPDFTIEMPLEWEVPASGELPNFDIYSKVPFTEDKFIEAIELRPSNRRVTHHSSIRARPLPRGTKLGKAPPWSGGPVPAVEVVPVKDETGERALGLPFSDTGRTFNDGEQNVLLIWVPGGGFQRFRPGAVRRITPDDYFQWRLHYTVTGRPEKDRHTLGLWFARGPVTHEVISSSTMDVRVVEGKELVGEAGKRPETPNIPALAENWTIMGIKAFPSDVTLNSVWPHMHLRGKDMTYTLTYPDGREETILRVPKYQFEWQFQYEFEEPLKIPAGTVMRVVSHYDNSRKNRMNPGPDKEVIWGSMVKQAIKRKHPEFNEQYYGYRSFSKLLESAQNKKFLHLEKDARSGSYIVTMTE